MVVLELNELERRRKMDLETIDSSFEGRLEYQTAAQTAFVWADARKAFRIAQYARSRVLRNTTVGQLVR